MSATQHTQPLKGSPMSYHANALHVEKHLLCLRECGCYISIHDLVSLASALNLSLAFKKRSLSIQTLFLDARAASLHIKLLEHMCLLLESKKEQLLRYTSLYPKTHTLLEPQINRIEATKSLLERESALHVKEIL